MRACVLFANGQRMAKVLALIALVLLSGFTGSGESFATTHASRMVLQVATVSAAETAANGFGHESQKLDYGVSAPMEVPEEAECCTDITCSNMSHCHHGGLSAMMASHMGGIGPSFGTGYGPSRHDIPTQNISESISKPPKT